MALLSNLAAQGHRATTNVELCLMCTLCYVYCLHVYIMLRTLSSGVHYAMNKVLTSTKDLASTQLTVPICDSELEVNCQCVFPVV